MWQAIKDIGVSVGEVFAPAIEKLTDYLIENKDEIAKWATSIAEKIRDALILAIWYIMAFIEKLKTGGVSVALKSLGRDIGFVIGEGIKMGLKSGLAGAAGRGLMRVSPVAAVIGAAKARSQLGDANAEYLARIADAVEDKGFTGDPR